LQETTTSSQSSRRMNKLNKDDFVAHSDQLKIFQFKI